ncbi:ferric uptake regulation protein [bacterium BMS3Abin02]|nr:ferric uptake regulation protein [bacterium BMS3Abin02]GBE20955.1 ferric uptake regulation protein [bacterium BMS3Bbin01]HDL48960.1 transcriptional repressor [Actinomycetota bacterium]
MEAEALVRDLRSEGLRITAARRAMCDALAASRDVHLNATEIRQRAEEVSGIRIDQSTVYRTIDVLERLGVLHHVHLGHGPAIVHLSAETDHQHLVCEHCGKTVDIPVDEVVQAFETLARRHSFTSIHGSHFAIVGTCEDCATG